MTPPEDKWAKVYGVALALICAAVLGVVAIFLFLWKTLCVPVIGAFAELGRDLKIIMKGEG